MKRGVFLAASASFAAYPLAARAQQFDPAQSASTASLRVLLGTGTIGINASGEFTFNGKPYRGTYTRDGDSIINIVSLEDYLYSVVPKEMSPSWPAAALQAQAICARTYVLQRSNPRRAYDLVPSEADQVYVGLLAESDAGRAAVNATQAQVLQYGGRYAQAMYSSCCGGHTESSAEAWGGAPMQYLAGVPCPYCVSSPNYRWVHDISRPTVSAAFASEIEPYGQLQGFYIGSVDPSGRARTIELRCERGSEFVKGTTFRSRVGPRVLPSMLITEVGPSQYASDATQIKGGGLGHGVGLCQWGARGMALEGRSSSQILQYYFPGTTIGHE